MISGFPPIASTDAEVLILGSIPSVKSLEEQQYYGHPRNAFWWIMGQLLGFDRELEYETRKECLIKNKIALWDVLHGCEREGSLDSAIKSSSVVTNDFAAFFAEHPDIRKVFFNGRTAEKEFQKHVSPMAEEKFPYLEYQLLPSTSPAMASLNKEAKLAQWQVIIKL